MSKCALCKTSLKDDEINVCDKCRLDFLNFKQQLEKAEQELAFYQDEIKNRGTCGLCEKLENKQIKELKEQLAEKDKEIEYWQQQATNTTNALTNDGYAMIMKAIRKQVCDEIREMALDYYYFQGDATKFDGNLYLISKFDLEENILNKLEQGEQQ